MIATAESVSPPVTSTQAGCNAEPVAFVFQRAAVSHRVPTFGPPVATITKYEPSGEKSTSRM